MSEDRRKPIGFVPTTPLPDNSNAEEPAATQRLVKWHEESEARFLHLLPNPEALPWPAPIRGNHYQLSYLITTAEPESLPDHTLHWILSKVAVSVKNTVRTGWGMFHPFDVPEIAPSFQPERQDGTGEDVYEANLMTEPHVKLGLPDFWRIALDGRATIVRVYLEDRMQTDAAGNPKPERWLDPETVIRETTEVVTHAKLLAQQFQAAVRVGFRCTWTGLEGRVLAAMNPAIYWRIGGRARANIRTTEGSWPVSALTTDWPTIVAELSGPPLRLFGFTGCTPELVERMAKRFSKL